MIVPFVWLAQIIAGPIRPPASPQPVPLAPAAILERYAAALHKLNEPRVISFDYTLDQTGLRTLSQTHRVFRSGNDERDETLTVDGKRLTPPKVRIFRGRRNRYTLALLAPRPQQYTFAYAGERKDGHHLDYVFRLAPKAARPFSVTEVTIDGVRFLPLSIAFATGQNEGQGSIVFGSNARWWVPYAATARAVIADNPATEKLTFYTYRFPATLPPSAFGPVRPAAAPTPEPITPPTRLELRVPAGATPFAPAVVPRPIPAHLVPHTKIPLYVTPATAASPHRLHRRVVPLERSLPRAAPSSVPPTARPPNSVPPAQLPAPVPTPPG